MKSDHTDIHDLQPKFTLAPYNPEIQTKVDRYFESEFPKNKPLDLFGIARELGIHFDEMVTHVTEEQSYRILVHNAEYFKRNLKQHFQNKPKKQKNQRDDVDK